MNPTLHNLSDDEWWALREIVYTAITYKKLARAAESRRGHPVVSLVEQYLAEREHRFIDEAAKMVALAKPGVTPEVAEREYWLVIHKS